MGCRGKGTYLTFALDDKAGRGHGSRNHPQLSDTRRGSTFAVYDQLLSIGLFFLPGKIVVVFHPRNTAFSQGLTDPIVNLMMAGSRIIPCEIHRQPVFGAGF